MNVMVGEDRERLAQYVVRRRVAMGYRTREEWAAAVGLSARTLGDIEKGRRPVGDATVARIEEFLGWKPGSTSAILRGGEPELSDGAKEAEPEPEVELDAQPAMPDFIASADDNLQAIWAGLEAIPELSHEERIHAIVLIKALRGAPGVAGGPSPTSATPPGKRNAS
jgi:transcriptional regulator with XRE-family HTH domain